MAKHNSWIIPLFVFLCKCLYDTRMKWIKDSILFHIFLLIVSAAIGYGSYRMARQTLAIYRESAVNQKKIEELKQKKQELEAYLDRLQMPGEIEWQAKERLNLKLPGEQVVVVVAQKASSTMEQAKQTGTGVWHRLAQFWKNLW